MNEKWRPDNTNLVRFLCIPMLLCILIFKLLSRFWGILSSSQMWWNDWKLVPLTRGLTFTKTCRQSLVDNQNGTEEKRLFTKLALLSARLLYSSESKCVCVYEKLILLRVGLTGAEDPGQGAKAVLAFAKSGAPRDYFSLCLWPAGHLRVSLGGW